MIVGDANRMETPQALKLGATSMLLWALEHAEEADFDMRGLIEGLRLADPVGAMHTVSHDLSLNAELALEQGGTTTAWQMQVRLRAAVYAVAAIVLGTDTAGEPAWEDRQTQYHGHVGAGARRYCCDPPRQRRRASRHAR